MATYRPCDLICGFFLVFTLMILYSSIVVVTARIIHLVTFLFPSVSELWQPCHPLICWFLSYPSKCHVLQALNWKRRLFLSGWMRTLRDVVMVGLYFEVCQSSLGFWVMEWGCAGKRCHEVIWQYTAQLKPWIWYEVICTWTLRELWSSNCTNVGIVGQLVSVLKDSP